MIAQLAATMRSVCRIFGQSTLLPLAAGFGSPVLRARLGPVGESRLMFRSVVGWVWCNFRESLSPS